MLAAFLQYRLFTRAPVDDAKPHLGLLFVEFLNLYTSTKLQTIDIRPFAAGSQIDNFPIQRKNNDFISMQITDPLNNKNNVAKSSFNFLQLENLLFFVYFSVHQNTSDMLLANVFETARVFLRLNQAVRRP